MMIMKGFHNSTMFCKCSPNRRKSYNSKLLMKNKKNIEPKSNIFFLLNPLFHRIFCIFADFCRNINSLNSKPDRTQPYGSFQDNIYTLTALKSKTPWYSKQETGTVESIHCKMATLTLWAHSPIVHSALGNYYSSNISYPTPHTQNTYQDMLSAVHYNRTQRDNKHSNPC